MYRESIDKAILKLDYKPHLALKNSSALDQALRHFLQQRASLVVRTNKACFNTFALAREMAGSPSPSHRELNVTPGMMEGC